MPTQLTITRPDDMHLHVRDAQMLAFVLPYTAQQFARAVIMPNLKPAVTTTALAMAYRARILAALPVGANFTPLMTLYLTDNTQVSEIKAAKESGAVIGVKYYPAGATTNSDAGVTQLEKVFPVLEALQEHELPLLLHGEVSDAGVDIFDREKAFIDQVLPRITQRFTKLRIVIEHLSTAHAVQYVESAPATIAATITPQHLRFARNDLLAGGIRPHYYCLPILKREQDRQALLRAATSGNPKFFLGTDSAPHQQTSKESACGCAGSFSAAHALEHYATIFEQVGALDKLEAFASHFGADFYRLPRNTGRMTLLRSRNRIPEVFTHEGQSLVPLAAGQELVWAQDPNQLVHGCKLWA